MNKYVLLLLAGYACSCTKKETAQTAENSGTVAEINTSNNSENTGYDYDVEISDWYILQYSAIEKLQEITNKTVNVGSKITDDPASVLQKQKVIALDYENKFKSDEGLSDWCEMQEIIAEKLCLSLSKSFTKSNEDMKPILKMMYYIDLQMKLLKDAGY